MTNYIRILIVGLILCFNLIDSSLGKIWDKLHMTWMHPPPPSNNEFAFANLPLTRKEAVRNEYKPLKDKNNLYKGRRYIRNDDITNILLFNTDHEGRLVGIQSQFPESKLLKKTKWLKWFEEDPMFIEEEKTGDRYFTLTAYTIDPKTIGQKIHCSKKVGCGLWFQQRKGSGVDEFWKIPLTTNEMVDDPWKEGKCVDGMAVHFVWNISAKMDCMNFRPFFILFMGEKEFGSVSSKRELTERQLTSFGWVIQGNFNFSQRLEHLPRNVGSFFYEVPECAASVWDETGGVTSIHFFLNDDPDKFRCPPGSNQKPDWTIV